MANDQPENFLLEFLVRARKRQAKLEETDSSLQPASKLYHAERIITSNNDDDDGGDIEPKAVKKNGVVNELPDVEEIKPDQQPEQSTNDQTSVQPTDGSPVEDEEDPLDLSEYLDGPILYRDDEPNDDITKVSNDYADTASLEDIPEEILEPSVSDTLSEIASEDIEKMEKSPQKKDLKYSLSIYRKENKHKSSNTPSIVSQPLSCDDSSSKSSNEEIIHRYEDKIRDTTNIIKQTGRALDLCYQDPKRRGTHEHLEFEKLLLTSSFRQFVYSNEIAKIRQSRRKLSQDGTTGTIRLSLIQLQLTNEFLQSLAEEKVLHCFLCLARCGPEIQCTELITSRDIRFSGRRRICFNEPLVFHNVPTNFQLLFEVYELVDEYPKSKKDINFFAPLTPSKRSTKHISNMLTPSSMVKERRTAFKSIGMLQVKLDQCQNVSFALDHVPEPGSIDGIVNMDITLKSVHTVVKKGMLHLLIESNEYPDWIRRWFVLREGQLLYWRHPEDETASPPLGIIDLHRCNCEKVAPCSPLDDLYRQNSLVFYTSNQITANEHNNLLERVYRDSKIIKHQMAANSKDERNAWSEALNFAIDTIRRWKSNSVCVMDGASIKKIMTTENS